MGSQPYCSLHFIYILGCIDQSDWEHSLGLRRRIKRQKCLSCTHPSLIIPLLYFFFSPHPERSWYCPKCQSRSDTSACCALLIDCAGSVLKEGFSCRAYLLPLTWGEWEGGREGGSREEGKTLYRASPYYGVEMKLWSLMRVYTGEWTCIFGPNKLLEGDRRHWLKNKSPHDPCFKIPSPMTNFISSLLKNCYWYSSPSMQHCLS